MAIFNKRYAFAILFGSFLTIYTIFVILDTFVIARIYKPLQAGDIEPFGPEEAVISESSYKDQNIIITISKRRELDTDIYVADIRLRAPEYIKTAFAQNSYGKNVTQATSAIAESNNAILAINGDFYGAQPKGYVIRNGEVYQTTANTGQEDLIIWGDGSFGSISEGYESAEELALKGAAQLLSFGPFLVKEGEITVSENDEVGKASMSNPRTALGIIGNLHYIFIVSDGRTNESRGLSLYELAGFLKSLGAVTAYNLDGGGSSTMVFNGEVLNKPTTNGRKIIERGVSDIVYIGY